MDADGRTALSYAQAQEQAREWFAEQAAALEGETAGTGPYTVSSAVSDYLAWMESEGKKTASDHRTRADALIVTKLGSVEAAKLTTTAIRRWRDELATAPARLRTRKGKAQKYRDQPDSDDDKRRRRATANRTLTILKAALNHAFNEGRIKSDLAWRRVKPFAGADAARVRFLKLAESRRLMNACAPEFRNLVSAALATGARYGELTALRARDFNSDTGTVLIATSKSGKARHVVLTDEGVKLFASLIAGQPEAALIFTKSDGQSWGKSHQARPLQAACEAAKIDPPVTFHELRHTYASLALMAGMSLLVLAGNLGHADTRMVEKHYGHLADSYRAKMIRETAPQFGIDVPEGVTSLVPRKQPTKKAADIAATKHTLG